MIEQKKYSKFSKSKITLLERKISRFTSFLTSDMKKIKKVLILSSVKWKF